MAKSGSGHRAFSRWMQYRTNARMIREVRLRSRIARL
jgi:hypothetical protein